MVAFGAATPLRGLLAVGPALLTGLAFGAPITAYAARLQNDYAIAALFRFGVVPLFLFSGTFFPITASCLVAPIAYAQPAVARRGADARAVALGSPTAYHPARARRPCSSRSCAAGSRSRSVASSGGCT
jgi:lipooligosaccharide transport system permease protein